MITLTMTVPVDFLFNALKPINDLVKPQMALDVFKQILIRRCPCMFSHEKRNNGSDKNAKNSEPKRHERRTDNPSSCCCHVIYGASCCRKIVKRPPCRFAKRGNAGRRILLFKKEHKVSPHKNDNHHENEVIQKIHANGAKPPEHAV